MSSISKPIAGSISADRMVVLFIVMLVTASGNTAMQSVLPTIGTQLGIPDLWITMAFSWSALLWVFTAPFWARQSDHRGRKKLMYLGMFGFSLSMLLAGIALYMGLTGWFSGFVTFGLFAAFRTLYGALGSAAPPAVQAYVAARTAPQERTKALSLIASSFGLGTIMGPAIAPLFVLPFIGLSGPMFAFTLLGIVVMVALAIRLPNDDPRYVVQGVVTSEPYSSASSANALRDEQDEAGNDKDKTTEVARPALQLRDPRIRNWLATGFIGGNVHAMTLGVIGFLILDRLGLRGDVQMGVEMTGIVLMSGAAATLLSQWGLIPLLQMGPRACVLWGMAIAAIGCALIASASGLFTIIVSFALASLGFGLFRPGFTAGASVSVGRSRQNAVAGFVTSVNGATFVAAPSLGVLLYGFYPPLPFWLAVGICLTVFLWSWRVLRSDSEMLA